MIDNLEDGELIFIDPSLADDFWSNPDDVQVHFNGLGINNLTHHKYTTQDFIHTQAYAELDDIGLLMVDGYHTAEQARFDYLAFLDKFLVAWVRASYTNEFYFLRWVDRLLKELGKTR